LTASPPLDRFLADLGRAGVQLWREGADLRYRAPRGVMTPAVLARLRAEKPTLLPLLPLSPESPPSPHTSRPGDASPDDIPRLPDAAHYALSHAQRRLWVLSQLDGSAAYNIPLHQRLDGPLDLAALTVAFGTLVARHEVLRTSITIDPETDEPRQKVRRPAPVLLAPVDVSGRDDPEAAARAIAAEAAAAPFDLTCAPLFRVSVLTLGPRQHLLLFTIHHIVCDGISIGTLGRDLAALYVAARHGVPPDLPPLALQYRDYAAWQQRQLAAGALDDERAFWLGRLGGERSVLELPTDAPRPATQRYRGAEHAWLLPPAAAEGLATLARGRQASLFMALCALVKVLLHRHTGVEDIIIAAPVAGRTHPSLEGQVGCYLNMLCLRDRVRATMPFSALLDAVRVTATDAYDHQRYPFDLLVDELRLPRDLSRSPVTDVVVILQNQAESALVLDDLIGQPAFGHNGTTKVDLTFSFKTSSHGLACAIEYNTDLFRAARIARMANHLTRIVTTCIAKPEGRICDVDLLDETERRAVTGSADTVTALPNEATLPDGGPAARGARRLLRQHPAQLPGGEPARGRGRGAPGAAGCWGRGTGGCAPAAVGRPRAGPPGGPAGGCRLRAARSGLSARAAPLHGR
jgi:hypothetical protein